jgi:hypothetical protein
MQETGVVTGLDGEFALVKVIRIETNGCGCGVSTAKQENLLRVRNLCKAEEGDRVNFESSYDRSKYRVSMQSAACVPAFITGALIGEYLVPLFGFAGSPFFSAVLGFFSAAAAFWVIRGIYRKKPLGEAAAYEIVSPYR